MEKIEGSSGGKKRIQRSCYVGYIYSAQRMFPIFLNKALLCFFLHPYQNYYQLETLPLHD
jgi:hypothetical protein